MRSRRRLCKLLPLLLRLELAISLQRARSMPGPASHSVSQRGRAAAGAWETGILRGSALYVDGQQVVGSRSAAIESPSDGTVVDSEARAAIDDILNTLRQHGLIEVQKKLKALKRFCNRLRIN